MKKKILFMGTPLFAAEILEHLLTFKELEVIGVIAQPDRKMSRRKKIIYSEVKESALKHNLQLFQPERISDFVDEIKQLNPDKIITCAYGQFLPQSILDFGVINVHASLLPKYRGGAPIQHAIINGEKETGISLMKSVLKMDAGPVYSKTLVPIDIKDTYTSLKHKMIEASKELISKTIIDIVNDKITPQEQDESLKTIANTIKREDEYIDFNRSQIDVYNHLRALIEVPCGYAFINGKRLKFSKVELGESKEDQVPSIIYFTKPDYFEVSTKSGYIKVLECQLEGKQRLSTHELFNGYQPLFHLERLNDE